MKGDGQTADGGFDLGVVADLPAEDSSSSNDLGSAADMPDVGTPDDVAIPELRDAELLFALRRDANATMLALGYDAARDAMYAVGGIEDRDGRIECVYTGRTVDTDGTRTPGGSCAYADGSSTTCAFNTEHIVPRVDLRGLFGDGTPEYNRAEGDLHHLFPTEELANGARGNFDFGATDCAGSSSCAFDELSQLGLPLGGTGPTSCPMGVDAGLDLCVMQVRPERRGDVARAVFYMSMLYGLTLEAPVEDDLRLWESSDAPDALEQSRNDAVENRQGNRNPFIDDPALLNRIADF